MIMKKMTKIFLASLTAGLLSVGTFAALAGCDKTAEVTPEIVTNFTINAETGEFSFTGVEVAKTYYVRIYNHSEKNEDGTEIPLEEKMPVAARRVRFKSDVKEYSGEVDFSEFTAGADYDAYVYTYIKTDDGDLIFASTEAKPFVYKTTYDTPAIDSDKLTAEIEAGKLSLTFNNAFFTDQYLDQDPSYLVTLYRGDNVVATKTIANSDVQVKRTESTNSSGLVEVTVTSFAKTTIDAVAELDGYALTVQVISTNDKAYYDSAVGAKVDLSSLVKAPETDDKPGGEGGGMESGGF